MRRAWPLVLAVALLAGCGDDDDDDEASRRATTTVTTTTARTQTTPKVVPARPTAFSRSADRICARYEGQIARLKRPTNPSQVPAFLQRSIALAREEVRQLSKLKPPPGQAPTARQLVANLRAIVRALEKLASATTTGSQQGVTEATQEATAAATAARRLAAQLGITACGQGAAQ
jgi:hypothetical protein